MRRRYLAMVAAAVVVASTIGVAVWLTQSPQATDAGTDAAEQTTASVERRTLQVTETLEGSLGHGDVRPILAGAPGTLTAAPEVGTRVERGGTLYEVNGRPTVLLYGATPAWRTLEAGVSGPDVEQLETNLVELGFGDALTVGETWDQATTDAVTAWQSDAGLNVDGRVELGEVAFEAGAVIVASVDVGRGGGVGPSMPVIQVTDTDRVVSAALASSRRDGVEVGDAIDVELGDGTIVDATITEIDATPTTAQDGSQTYGMRLTLDNADADIADGQVSLHLVRQERAEVLAVPVNALLALLEGGYAVERVTDDGAVQLVAVDVGLFADGWVEVSGELAAGDQVVVP